MDSRIGDHTPAPVSLGFARLKLRFDEHDNFAVDLQQRHGRWQDFFKRNKGTIHNDQIGCGRKVVRLEKTRVGFFHHDDARIAATDNP